MIRIKDIVALFKVSRNTVYKWLAEGMPVYRVGKLLFFDKCEIVEWVKNKCKK